MIRKAPKLLQASANKRHRLGSTAKAEEKRAVNAMETMQETPSLHIQDIAADVAAAFAEPTPSPFKEADVAERFLR